VPLAALFSLITLAFAAIALWSATARQWVIAVAAAALAAWMGTLAWSGMRKRRR
jgi:heme O synthase-like polyprenyltransferase